MVTVPFCGPSVMAKVRSSPSLSLAANAAVKETSSCASTVTSEATGAVFVPMEGARYEIHGIKQHPAVLLANYNAKKTLSRIEAAAVEFDAVRLEA